KFAPLGSPDRLLGADDLGRDVLARAVYGIRLELLVCVTATALAMILGVLIGLVGGFFGGFLDFLTMRGIDVVLAFPPIILALLITALYGQSTVTLIVAMVVIFLPAFARVTYAQVLTVRSMDYVHAAQVFGASTGRRLFSVTLPNSL